MIDIKPFPPARPVPLHLLISLGGTILYAPGDWGAELPVGETARIEVNCRDMQFRFGPRLLGRAETNSNGDFMIPDINSSIVRVGRDFVFLSVYDKRSKNKSSFNITNPVNWRLTMQSQLLDPLAVHWGP